MKQTDGNHPMKISWRWTTAWVGFAAISGATLAYFVAIYVPHERAGAIDVWRGRLSAMADDRKAAITTWVAERRADAEVLSEYSTVALLIDAGHGASVPLHAEEAPRLHLQGLLDSMRAAYGYSGVYVINASGQVMAASTGSPPLETACRASVARVLSLGHPEVDFHAHESGVPMVAITIAVRVADRTVGAVLLAMDPGRWLYPLLRSEPTHTSTAESLLARQSGDQIEFLSPLRHNPAPPLTVRVPLATSRLAAVSAVRGEEVFAQYMDYRGVRALGVTRRIPNTGWGLVVKVDEDEALAGFSRSIRQGAFAIAGLLLAVAGLGFGANRAMAGRHRRELGESEARFALLRDHARDGIWFVNRDGVIVDANEAAAAMHGCTREEVIGRNVRDFRSPGDPETVPRLLDTAARRKGLEFETLHVRRDGSVFPIEVSTQAATFYAEEVFFSIYRDITERKHAEARITTLNRLLRTISEVNQLIVRERDRDRLLAEACRIVVEHGGFRMAWVGFTDETTGTVVPATWAGLEDGYLGEIAVRFDDTPLGNGPTGIAIREGRVVVANDLETDEHYVPWLEAARARGYRSSASFPLSAGGKVTGALSVYAAEASAFDAEVTGLLSELANDIAFALEAMNAAARREAAEKSLAGSEERFRIAAETSNDVVYEWDLKQSVQWFGNIDEILGYRPGEFPRTLDGWAASVHPDDVERAMAAIRAHLEKQVPYALEYRVRRQDGTYRWWTARGAAARTPDGKPVRWVGTITDITELKRDEEALRESEARYRTLVENIPQKIFMKDRSLRWVSINEKLALDFGFRPEEVVGKVNADLFTPELAAKYQADDVRILETGRTEELEEKYMLEGRETWVHTIKTPVRDTNGQIVGVLGVFWDITERKRADNALQRQTAELKARNEELMRFNDAVVGRELRMVELKQEVNELCGQLGKPPMYSLGFLEAGSQAPIRAPDSDGHEPTGEE
jgi:PAS domain S-box-containing protein